MHKLTSTLLLACAMWIGGTGLVSADAAKKVVLQISEGSAEKQSLVLNVANNLQKEYGIDNVDIEIVAFGPGLRLLFKENANKGRIEGLASNGVRFAACQNTVQAVTKTLGHAPVLSEHSVSVSAGVIRIMELTDKGYTLIKP